MAGQSTSLCWSCANACGGCSWTEKNDENEIKFEPVPGWKAKKTKVVMASYKDYRKVTESYHVIACPLYVEG